MKNPKDFSDLGTCVVKRKLSKKHCDYFLRFRGFPQGQGLVFRSFAFEKRGIAG